MDDMVLETRGLSKEFGGKTAVDGLTLRVRHGDIYGFLGPNGAGKSTAIRMMTGLIRPTCGSAALMGFDIRSHRTSALRRVGALVESPAFYRYLSARENLRILGRMSGACDDGRVSRALEIVGLSGDADRKVGVLSQGMRQRLGIGQAILLSPRLLILDEPTNGLDPQGMKDVRDLIVRMAREEDVTVFISSHLLHEVEQICTRVGIINHGRLLAEDGVRELLSSDSGGIELRVGDPRTAVEALRRMGIENVSSPEGIENGRWKIEVRDPGCDSSKLNRGLVEAGVDVFEIRPKARTLEDLFLDLVREDADAS
jgi:ABC-2 type transport system ATP-binding protein